MPGPQAYAHIDFTWIGSSPSMCEKKQFFGALFFFLQGPISSHKTKKGHATKKNKPQRGIANLTCKQYYFKFLKYYVFGIVENV